MVTGKMEPFQQGDVDIAPLSIASSVGFVLMEENLYPSLKPTASLHLKMIEHGWLE